MITEDLRELLADLIMETRLPHMTLSLDSENRMATLTISQVDERDFDDLVAMTEEMVQAPHPNSEADAE